MVIAVTRSVSVSTHQPACSALYTRVSATSDRLGHERLVGRLRNLLSRGDDQREVNGRSALDTWGRDLIHRVRRNGAAGPQDPSKRAGRVHLDRPTAMWYGGLLDANDQEVVATHDASPSQTWGGAR